METAVLWVSSMTLLLWIFATFAKYFYIPYLIKGVYVEIVEYGVVVQRRAESLRIKGDSDEADSIIQRGDIKMAEMIKEIERLRHDKI